MLMSKSRLEKFLYALYSLDSSDLPTPLSRIEELYKCLVTGEEAPTFKPISRVEKYLMAILGAYNVNELPNPLSRVEVLLYKLATGDDNLDDVKSFLSEHEELLAEIIKNGGAGGNINIEYVLYTLSTEFNTLYNTAEKPVKSAILKGQTLVNLVGEKRLYDHGGTGHLYGWEFMLPYNLTKGKTYLAVFNATGTISSTNSKVYLMDDGFESNSGNSDYAVDFKVGYNMVKCVASGDNHRVLRIRTSAETLKDLEVSDVMLIEYQEGMENWGIPYFEGMQSVKLPVLTTSNLGNLVSTYNLEQGGIFNNTGVEANTDFIRSDFIEVEYAKYTLSHNGLGWTKIFEYDENKNFIRMTNTKADKHTTEVTNTTRYIRAVIEISYSQVNPLNISLCPSESTNKEPYKSNILTVNEEVELRGIGEVKDELNCLTGELTQRIGEVVLDGKINISWQVKNIDSNECIYFGIPDYGDIITSNRYSCDNFKFITGGINTTFSDDTEFITNKYWTGNGYGLAFSIKKSKLESLDSNGFNNYLRNAPTTVHYNTKQESIKTVDLSVVDQDGNNTKLKTFNDITHVTLSSEGLIPEAELEVATKNEEDLEDSSVYTTHTLSEEHNTLYNTAEKPVKSAILKGNTLVNLAKVRTATRYNMCSEKNIAIKPNTKYIALFNPTYHEAEDGVNYALLLVSSVSLDDSVVGGDDAFSKSVNGGLGSEYKAKKGYRHLIFTSKVNETYLHIRTGASHGILYTDMIILEYQEGMENWDIPYFEGMQSVKMPVLTTTGKNIFDMSAIPTDYLSDYVTPPTIINGKLDRVSKLPIFKLKPNTTYTMSIKINKPTTHWIFTFANSSHDSLITVNSASESVDVTKTFTTNNDGEVYFGGYRTIQYHLGEVIEALSNGQVQLEESQSATSYEPFKSNILTVNEDVTLRGIGDVKDTLDCLTGELTERTGEVVLDGSETGWRLSSGNTNDLRYGALLSDANVKLWSKTLNDTFVDGDMSKTDILNYVYGAGSTNGIIVTVDKNNLEIKDINGFKTWLSQNPITVQYQLATESIKTVDLSVVDQDGNNTKLKTFNDITHVTLSSEALIPEAELEVAEKVPEVAASMLTISREQEVINATTNEQSENVDATMIATTEIYEDLL